MTTVANDVELIRARMHAIRLRLPQNFSAARQDVKQLSDWKFYVRRYPAVILPLVSLASFALIPKKASVRYEPPAGFFDRVLPSRKQEQKEEKVAQRSFLTGIISAAAGMALRSATSFAVSRASGWVGELVNNRHSQASGSGFPNTRT